MRKIKKVISLRDAGDDLLEGRQFYDSIEPGVGDYFWDSIMGDIKSLVLYGGIHSHKHGFYRMPAKRFPYSIYYTIDQKCIYVIAVLPMRQDPELIKEKLTERRC